MEQADRSQEKMTLGKVIDILDSRGVADRIEPCPACPTRLEAHNLVHHLVNSHAWTADDVRVLFAA